MGWPLFTNCGSAYRSRTAEVGHAARAALSDRSFRRGHSLRPCGGTPRYAPPIRVTMSSTARWVA